MYVGFDSGEFMYINIREGAGLYMLTLVTSTGHTGDLQQICGKRIFPGYLLRFGFLICMVIGGQGCPHILVIFVLVERTRLSSVLVILYRLGGFFPQIWRI
jgi:hypothetical protein